MNSELKLCPETLPWASPRAEDLTRERVELKYIVAPERIETFLSGIRASAARPSFRMEDSRITTVYFDRPDGLLVRLALSGAPRAVKVRLREYLPLAGPARSSHVWIEVKARDGTTSRKTRFPLFKELVAPFFRGYVNVRTPGRVNEGVLRIRRIARGGPLVAVGAVSYRRLAVEGGNPRERLTVDCGISYHPGSLDLYESRGALDLEALGPAAVEDAGAIAELKYRGPRLPASWNRFLRAHPPTEFSKFRTLSALAFSDAQAAFVAVD